MLNFIEVCLSMLKKNNPSISNQKQLLNVHQAAEYLGVHTGTIRRWAYAKRLNGSKIGIRGDWRFRAEELIRIANSELNSELNEVDSVTYPQVNWGNISEGSHLVQFYENEKYLIDSVREYIQNGDSAIVIATQDHINKLEEGLEFYGLEINEARHNNQYVALDAVKTLDKFMVRDMPSRRLFMEHVGKLVKDTVRPHSKLRAFGEMVALLWANGNQAAAIKLEELWNELQKKYDFSLVCAYPLKGFDKATHSVSFGEIEALHSRVVPAESFSKLDTEDKRLREIALLQQRSLVLEAEIEKRKSAELQLIESISALKASEEFNRRIIENSADCIKVLDLNGNLLTINQPGCRLLELDYADQLTGKNFISLWEGEYRREVIKAIKAAKKGAAGRFQGYCPTAKGTPRWWDVAITPIYDKNGKAEKLLAITRDITSIKDLEQRKEDFISAASHELKTPLTSQTAFIHLLQKEVEKNKDEKYIKYVKKINDQTVKLTKLATDLVNIYKFQGGKLIIHREPFNINNTIQVITEEIQPFTNKHKIYISGKISRNVFGDEEKISQVVSNLLTNAVKYSPNSDKINVDLKENDNHAIISVQDFGIGIGDNDQKKVFERFYRVSDNSNKTFPGMGMGLYIASEIVKQHGGGIYIKSVKGKETTFSFTVPLINPL
jgi:PAS domain S-box-containing protein/excisionase family DNA binding protein